MSGSSYRPQPRSGARIAGIVIGGILLVAGITTVVLGGLAFAHQSSSPDLADDSSGFGPVVALGVGGFMVVFGLGFIGGGRRRLGGRGGIGRSPGVAASTVVTERTILETGTRPCPRCGVQARDRAAFCDSCGTGLA